jgi:hypothetical protein
VVSLFAAVVALNLGARAALDASPSNRAYWLVKEKWARVLHGAPAEVLVLGDSSCNQGLDPAVLTSVLGVPAVNLCTVGDLLAVNDVWMLAEWLVRHPAPKDIIVMHAYDGWHRGESYVTRNPLLAKIPLPWGFWRRMKPSLAISANDEWALAAARWLPLWAENKTLSTWLLGKQQPPDEAFALTDAGFMAVKSAHPVRVAKDVKEHKSFLARNKSRLSAANAEALEQLKELARAHGLRVWLVPSPVAKTLARERSFLAYWKNLKALMDAKIDDEPRVSWLMADPLEFAPNEMENADHVTARAAERLSRAVATALARARE